MDAFLGEIRFTAFGWPPKYWVLCDGAALPINQYYALYALVSTTFGGDAKQFNLPNLVNRFPMHRSAAHPLGTYGGSDQLVPGTDVQAAGAGIGPTVTPKAVGLQPILCVVGCFPRRD